MAAASRTGTSGGVDGMTYTTAQIDTLLGSFEAGDLITKAAVDTLLDYYDDTRDHTHAIQDWISDKTFGNTGGNDKPAETLSASTGLNATPSDPGTNSVVTASVHNSIRNAVNSLRGHVHSWDDQTS